jgi:hypothetical protein
LASPIGSGDFVTVNFPGVMLLSQIPTPNLEDPLSLPFDLSARVALPGAYAPASIALRAIEARKPPLLFKAVVLEKCIKFYLISTF